MPEGIPDLWPDEIATEVVTPYAILRMQASHLRRRTENLLEAEVVSEEDAGQLRHYLEIIAPSLERYRFRLLTAKHEASLVYPVTIESDAFDRPVTRVVADTQEEFVEGIGKVLRSSRARSVIHSLIARTNEMRAAQAQ